MRDWQRCVDAGERAVRGLPLGRRPSRAAARGASGRNGAHSTCPWPRAAAVGGSRRSSGLHGAAAATTTAAAPDAATTAAPRHRPRHQHQHQHQAAPAPSAPAPAPAPAPASAPSSASRRGRMSPGGDSPGRLPVEDVAEAALWAAGADSDGDLDAPRPGAAATGAARPDGAAPADEAGAARGRRRRPRGPCWTRRRPQCSAAATLSNSSSIASEKNDEPKAPGVLAAPPRASRRTLRDPSGRRRRTPVHGHLYRWSRSRAPCP